MGWIRRWRRTSSICRGRRHDSLGGVTKGREGNGATNELTTSYKTVLSKPNARDSDQTETSYQLTPFVGYNWGA